MKIIFVYLFTLKFFVQAGKRVKILDITGGFKDEEYHKVGPNKQNGGTVNYTLKSDLQIIRVVDGPMRIWSGHHVGENCTFCHVTNHNSKPALVLLYIQHFNSFYSIHRYRLFHDVWVPISRRFYNEIAKVIAGFEGEEYDLELHIDQEFSPTKVSVTKQEGKSIKHLKINPNVGYHIDLVIHEETILWERNERQDEAIEVNVIYENGELTYMNIVYEDYYCYADTLYYRFERGNKWVPITRSEYYHKGDPPNTLKSYKFPSEDKEKDSEVPTGEEKDDEEEEEELSEPRSLSVLTFQPGIDFSRPLNYRRFPRPSIVMSNTGEPIEIPEETPKTTEETQPTSMESEDPNEPTRSKRARRYEYDEETDVVPVPLSTDIPLTQPQTTIRITSYEETYNQYQITTTTPQADTSTVYTYPQPIMATKVTPTVEEGQEEDEPRTYTNLDDPYGQPSQRRRMYDYDETRQQQFQTGYGEFQHTDQQQQNIQTSDESHYGTPQQEYQQSTVQTQPTDTQTQPQFQHYVITPVPEYPGYSYTQVQQPSHTQENVQQNVQKHQTIIFPGGKNYIYPNHFTIETPQQKEQQQQQQTTDQTKQGYKRKATYLRGQTKDGRPQQKTPQEHVLTSDDPNLSVVPEEYSDLLNKDEESLEKDLRFFEDYYLDFDDEDAEGERLKKRKGDQGIYHEKKVDIKIKGRESVSINLYELDDANPNYHIETQSYRGVPVFKILPKNRYYFKEILAGFNIVWVNQDVAVGLAIKVAIVDGNFGAVELVVRRLSNMCYLHYKYERGYYRSVHTPTYVSYVNKYAMELEEEQKKRIRERAEEELKKKKKIAEDAGWNQREQEVRDYERKKEKEGVKFTKGKKFPIYYDEPFALAQERKKKYKPRKKKGDDSEKDK